MTNKTNGDSSPLNRIIDANLNRLREGIRVVEDIYRYIYNNKQISSKLKDIRHDSRVSNYDELLDSRDIINDCLKGTTTSEKNRDDLKSIIIANFKRAQESARVLEEVLKLTHSTESGKFKNIRYELYNLEKSILEN
jgi:thiamine-phosphate pyrophosphorylase